MTVIRLLTILAAAWVLTGCSNVSLTSWVEEWFCGFDQETYRQLRKGLSFQEVVTLSGCKGDVIRKWTGDSGSGELRTWPAPGGKVLIRFDEGVVTSWDSANAAPS